MGVPDRTSLEPLFPEMALSLKRGAHFALAPLIKFLVVVAVPQQIALGPGVASRLHSGLPILKIALSSKRGAHPGVGVCAYALSLKRRARRGLFHATVARF